MCMRIDRASFEQDLERAVKQQTLVLMGMSGSGKTHWARALAEKYGYNHIEFDELIAKADPIAEKIKDNHGLSATERVAAYLGMPWTKGFGERQAEYLACEREVMIRDHPVGSIIDFTGSCAYHPEQLADFKKYGALMVYLETSLERLNEMFAVFMADPKPVCWNGSFNMREGESTHEALRRCYPELIRHRDGLYRASSDVIIPYSQHKGAKTAEEFAQAVAERLPSHLDSAAAFTNP